MPIPSRLSSIALVALPFLLGFAGQAQTGTEGHPTTEQIVSNLVEHNRERAADLKGYTSKRTYRLEYHGFPGSKEAEMVVDARYVAPSSKTFEVVSENGSKVIINRVFRRLLQSEEEAANKANQAESAISPENYDFSYDREEMLDGRQSYVLRAEPKRKDKFLFRGYVWIDAQDFAVAQVQAEPAKNPSFWISKTDIEHRYTKVGEFWLPARNVSRTSVRLGGEATLTIDYGHYDVSSQVAQTKPRDYGSQSTRMR